MDILSSEYPCRNKQIDFLDKFFGEIDEPVPGALFVYGPPAVGKTSIVARYLDLTKAKYVLINCLECYTHRLLFEPLIRRLTGKDDLRCENFMDFVTKLKVASIQGYLKNTKTVIVLDGFENILELNENYFDAFSSLQELTKIFSLTVIFISHLIPEKFNCNSSIISIHFPQYNKDELLQILIRDTPEGYSEQFYKNYLNAALSVFLRTTRDLKEMKYLVVSNFTKYCEPINKEQIKADNIGALWRQIVPHLKASLNTVYLGAASRNDDVINEDKDELVTNKLLLAFDLPYYAKYFLIAAYLASYNSPKHDKRLYVKNHGKVRKRAGQPREAKGHAAALLGPKPFSLDRLLAIFYAIMQDKASLTANLMAQISTLVELRLLSKLGDGAINKPKYKCHVGFQCVDAVARTLGFNLRKYLID